MLNPERNDVDISKLFKWGRESTIYDASNRILFTCYIRLVGDAEMNRARVYALRRSAEMRKKLKTAGTDERLAYIADKELVTKEELIKYVLIMKNRTFTEGAYKDVKIPTPKEPGSDATLEEQERYQAEIDSFGATLQQKVKEAVEDKWKKEEARLNTLSFSDLFDTYEQEAINEICELEMVQAFKEACCFHGTYKDHSCKEKVFSSIDEYKSLPSEIKIQLERDYDSIEIDIETLKKLPGAIQ